MGLDRSIDQRCSTPLRRFRGRILRKILWRQRLCRRYLWRYGGRCRSGLRDHGFLHMHEDSGDHETQSGSVWRQATQYIRNLYGHLPQGGYSRYQPWGQCCGNTTDHQLGIEIWAQPIGGDGNPKGHWERERGEDGCNGKDTGQWLGRWSECVEPAYRSHSRRDAEQDGRPKEAQELDSGEDLELCLLAKWPQGALSWCGAPNRPGSLADNLHGSTG